jgi:hypothetical protein
MFLPVLLLRDFGIWSFAIFAIPNVIGAAAMGWVLRAPDSSRRLVANHPEACRAFSIITRAFQYFFLVWILLGVGTRWLRLLVLIAFVVGLLLGFSHRRTGRMLAAAIVLLLVSIALLLASADMGGLRWPSPLAAVASLPPVDLVWLAPVCIFGFLLCPYLDLTFHTARQTAHGRTGTRAFVLGFGAFFLAMIVGTLLYSWMFLESANPFGGQVLRTAPGVLVLCHIGAQLGYTTELHRTRPDPRTGHVRRAQFGWGEFGMLAGFATVFLPRVGALSSGEVIYRCFMAFYGLVFPAYVWICVIPLREGNPPPTRVQIVTWIIAVAAAAPMFWMGFIARETSWLAPGLGVVLFARLALISGRAKRA